MDFARTVWYNDSMKSVVQNQPIRLLRILYVVGAFTLAIVLTMAGWFYAHLGEVAAAETYGLNIVTTEWTYDGTMHPVYEVAEDYEGAYTVVYYAVSVDAPPAQVDEIVDAGQYLVEIVAEADDKYDAYAGPAVLVTVAKRALTVTVQPVTSVYGNRPTAPVAACEGLVEGDALPYLLTCEVNKRSAVGTYDVGYTPINDNYEVTLVGGENAYTVSPRPVTVTADNKHLRYGDNARYLTATVTEGNIVGGDKVYTLSCTPDGKTPNARTHSGVYPIVVSDLGNPNYTLTAVNGTYTVDRLAVTIAIEPVSSTYGEAFATLTADDSEVLYGDVRTYALSTAATVIGDVGTYDVVGAAVNTDYDITFVGGAGAYTITPRVLSVTWSGTQFVYDGTPQLPTITLGNVLEGDVVAATVEGVATDAGIYTATATDVDNGNYVLPALASIGFYIDKADATFDLTNVKTVFAYTGEQFSLTGVVTSGETAYLDNEFCEVGYYDVTIESAETANYRAGSMVVTVTVREAAPVVDEAMGSARYYKRIDVRTAAGKVGEDMSNIFNDAFADLESTTVTVTAYVGDASIVFDRAAVEAVAGYEVHLTYRQTTEIAEDLPQDALLMMDVGLDGATLGKGTATISIPFVYATSKNEILKVYYVSDEGEMVDMQATVEGGVLTFSTNHFSRFFVVKEVKLTKSAVTGIVLGSLFAGLTVMVGVLLVVRNKTLRAAKESLEE